MIRAAALILFGGAGGTAQAEGLTQIDYDVLEARVAGLFDFEGGFEPRPEPGQSIDGLIAGGANLWVGEHFTGQAVTGDLFDRIMGAPTAPPLTALPGPSGQNHAVAFHAGFGSTAALPPLGPPVGYPSVAGRGEGGAIAIQFAEEVDAFGLRIHSDYADPPLGTRPTPGMVTLRFFARNGGAELSRHDIQLDTGITQLGGFTGPGIAGVLITNTDPGGIAWMI